MTLSTLNLGNNGTVVYLGHAGFLVSTVGIMLKSCLVLIGYLVEFEPMPPSTQKKSFWYVLGFRV